MSDSVSGTNSSTRKAVVCSRVIYNAIDNFHNLPLTCSSSVFATIFFPLILGCPANSFDLKADLWRCYRLCPY